MPYKDYIVNGEKKPQTKNCLGRSSKNCNYSFIGCVTAHLTALAGMVRGSMFEGGIIMKRGWLPFLGLEGVLGLRDGMDIDIVREIEREQWCLRHWHSEPSEKKSRRK